MVFFDSVSCVVITGANRGYGKALALSVLEKLLPNSQLILHSRSGEIPWLENIRDDIIVTTFQAELNDLSINWDEKLESMKEENTLMINY
jgi:NAD(P)-dependent dehydrogenase (short-subunit alcohol dehydrogenase family)